MRRSLKCFSGALLACALAAGAAAAPPVVTFDVADLGRLVGEVCGIGVPANATIHVHRNPDGTMVTIIVESTREAVVFGSSQQCNPLDEQTLDVYRTRDGVAVAQRVKMYGTQLVLVGDTELRGRRFDVEPTGTYVGISQGASSTISALDRPYRAALRLNLDLQRLFTRRGGLVAVGGNPQSRQLEAHLISASGGNLQVESVVPVGGMPGEVRVLDYDPGSDTLLLGGVDSAGQPSFVSYNLRSGQGAQIPPMKPGDTRALFLADARLRARLTGSSRGISSGPEESGPSSRRGLRLPFFGRD